MAEPTGRGRDNVRRSALLFTPFFLAAAALEAYLAVEFAAGPRPGAIVGLVIVGVVTLLLGFESIQSVRDLVAQPVEIEDQISRKWSRTDAIFFQNWYVMVGGKVFRIEKIESDEVEEGDTARVRYYPHTMTVDDFERVRRKGTPAP